MSDTETKVGNVMEVHPDDVIDVKTLSGGPSDDGTFGLVINDQVYRVQMPMILRLAMHVIVIHRVINNLFKEETKCARD